MRYGRSAHECRRQHSCDVVGPPPVNGSRNFFVRSRDGGRVSPISPDFSALTIYSPKTTPRKFQPTPLPTHRKHPPENLTARRVNPRRLRYSRAVLSLRPLSADGRTSIEVTRLKTAEAHEAESLTELIARTGNVWSPKSEWHPRHALGHPSIRSHRRRSLTASLRYLSGYF